MSSRVFVTAEELRNASEVGARRELLDSQQFAIRTIEKYESFKEQEVERRHDD